MKIQTLSLSIGKVGNNEKIRIKYSWWKVVKKANCVTRTLLNEVYADVTYDSLDRQFRFENSLFPNAFDLKNAVDFQVELLTSLQTRPSLLDKERTIVLADNEGDEENDDDYEEGEEESAGLEVAANSYKVLQFLNEYKKNRAQISKMLVQLDDFQPFASFNKKTKCVRFVQTPELVFNGKTLSFRTKSVEAKINGAKIVVQGLKDFEEQSFVGKASNKNDLKTAFNKVLWNSYPLYAGTLEEITRQVLFTKDSAVLTFDEAIDAMMKAFKKDNAANNVKDRTVAFSKMLEELGDAGFIELAIPLTADEAKKLGLKNYPHLLQD